MALFEAAAQSKHQKARTTGIGMETIWWIAAVATGIGISLHFIRTERPFWLDETWTGVTVAQKTFPAFLDAIYNDVCGPLYYVVLHFWSLFFGLSDGALRLASALACALAPLFAFSLDRRASPQLALLWCALAAIWVPGIVYSEEARCYGLLFLLSMASTAAYANLLLEPSLRRATIWTFLSALVVLTHYHAGFLVLCQGIGYLAVHRSRALRTWPATVMFIPAVAWVLYHAPRLAQLVAPDVAWYPPLRFYDLIQAAGFVGLDVVLLVAFFKWSTFPWRKREHANEDAPRVLEVVFAASVIGAAIIFAIGIFRPSFTTRYVFPYAPGVLLGAALFLYNMRDRWLRVSAVLILLLAASPVALLMNRFSIAKNYNWEIASQALMQNEPQRLLFLWDHPATKILDARRLKGLGGFFFAREGTAIDVEPIYLNSNDDPNKVLIEKAGDDPKAALLWIYDHNLAATAARRNSPQIATLDPSWTCQNFGKGPIGIIACSHKKTE